MKYAALEHCEVSATPSEITERLDALERMPAILRSAVALKNADALRARPSPAPDAFSLHEHVWHLCDLEELGYSKRWRAIATEAHPFLADVDGTKLAIERRYLELPIAEALDRFERTRASNVAQLRALPHAAFARRGELEGVGCLTLAQLLERWCDHDAVHRSEIAELG